MKATRLLLCASIAGAGFSAAAAEPIDTEIRAEGGGSAEHSGGLS